MKQVDFQVYSWAFKSHLRGGWVGSPSLCWWLVASSRMTNYPEFSWNHVPGLLTHFVETIQKMQLLEKKLQIFFRSKHDGRGISRRKCRHYSFWELLFSNRRKYEHPKTLVNFFLSPKKTFGPWPINLALWRLSQPGFCCKANGGAGVKCLPFTISSWSTFQILLFLGF